MNKEQNFNDIVADKTDWTLLNTASASLDPRKMVYVNNQRIEYTMTWGLKLFLSIFIIVGLAGLSVHKAFVFFIFMGAIGLYWTSFPIVFDKERNVFFRGRRSELFMDFVEIDFTEIYALQLIGGRISGSDGGSYNSYQINLINKDSKRLNVIYYSNKAQAKQDAAILKGFLGTKLWDVS